MGTDTVGWSSRDGYFKSNIESHEKIVFHTYNFGDLIGGLADHGTVCLKLLVVALRAIVREEQLSEGHEKDNHCGHDEGHAPRGFVVGDGPEAVPDAHH